MLALLTSEISSHEDKLFFTQLYRKYEKMMFFIAKSILRSQEKAEEAVHDTFVKAIEHLGTLKGKNEEELKAWLIVVVKHVSINTAKRECQVEYFDLQENPQDQVVSYTVDITEDINYNRLKELIRELPETYRSVLYLRFVCAWSYAEIAKELGISVNLVGSRLLRGREVLIQKLAEENAECSSAK
jgi:RNA polymerase sigma-70 factor (ECF subfamily)